MPDSNKTVSSKHGSIQLRTERHLREAKEREAKAREREAKANEVRPHSKKGAIKDAQLPTKGKMRYVPDSRWTPKQPLPRGENNGYLDRFNNEWTKGPSRTKGQAFEWDVQLDPHAPQSIRNLSRDGSHLNISLDGKVTHK